VSALEAMFWFVVAVAAFFLFCLAVEVAVADEHHDEAVKACRHILSPAMATAHPEYEHHIFRLCVERQDRVPWRLHAEHYQ